MNRSHRHRCTHLIDRTSCGFSLLEVVLALGIFFGSLAMLSQISWNGSRAAVQSRLNAQAMFLAESKLNEIISGAEVLADQQGQAFADNDQWKWSLVTGQTDFPELLLVQVTVTHDSGSSLGNASITLRRFLRDPNVFIEAAEQKAALEAEQSSSSSSSSTGTTQ